MSNVPKTVLKQLEAPAGEHPDADLLTAFAERSLPESERTLVLNHLSLCSDCREVIALALPATEAVNVAVSARPARVGWLTTPALRWGVVAAGVLIVTSFGVLQYRQTHPGKEKQLAAAVIPRETITSTPVQIPATSAQTSVAPAALPHTEEKMQLDKRVVARKQFPSMFPQSKSASDAGATAGGASRVSPGAMSGSGGGIVSGSGAGVEANAPAARVVEAQRSAPAPTTNTASAQVSDQLAKNNVQQPLQGRDAIDLSVARAKAPVPAAAAAMQAPSIALHTSPSLMQHAVPRWMITSSGGLRRSLDAGMTWEEVNVNSGSIAGSIKDASGAVIADASVTLTNLDTTEKHIQSSSGDGLFTFANLSPGRYRIDVEKPGFNHLVQSPVALAAQQTARLDAALQVGQVSEAVEVAAATSMQVETSSSGLENMKKNRLRQEKAMQAGENQKHWLSTPNPVFRALAANGSEVWAGGSNSVLYHSLDAGAHWTHVLPSSAGTELTGDITAVDFSDLQHGRITTSTPEVWTTADDGQTWQKQP
ncbi:MAG: carboxypeptidase regulatory-like domain-containing protein [Candidatus Sulfotelmatobacter sp.]